MNAMTPIDAKAHALALYATACESHRRQDWRMSAHALAAVLKALDIPERISQAAEPVAAVQPRPKAPKAAKGARSAKVASYVMTAESLTRALRLLKHANPARTSHPILECVLIESRSDGNLALTCTDLDKQMTVIVEAEGAEQWSVAVPMRPLLDILSKAKGAVRLAPLHPVNDIPPGLQVSGAVSVTMQGRLAEDFPLIPAPDNATPVDMSVEAWTRALAFVSIAMSTEETRYYLNGAYIHSTKTGLAIVATDGHRLNVIEETPLTPCDLPGAIIPYDTVKTLRAMLAGAGFVTVGISKTHIISHAGAVSIMSKLIDGNFPDYTRVIPNPKDGTRVLMDSQELGAMVRKVSAVSNEKSQSTRFAFSPGAVMLTCRNMEGGESSDTLPCTYKGEDLVIPFNGRYVQDAMATLGAGPVQVTLYGPHDPIRVQSKGDPSRVCVLMPLRV